MEDLLNQVRATLTDTYDTIDFGKEDMTLAEVAATKRGLKSKKAAGEDKIRPEMSKVLRVWQTDVSISIYSWAYLNDAAVTKGL